MSVASMGGPRVSSGKDSVQEVGTPTDLLDAVRARFGPITCDLAANGINHVADNWFGPGGVAPDALVMPWAASGLLWLNPPFGTLAPWAAKCSSEAAKGSRIALLVPASVGSNWFADHVDGRARVLFLRPRLTFVGHTQPYPKDLILVMYGEAPGYECWRWRP